MPELSNLQILINGQETFFVNEEIISAYSGRIRKVIKQQKNITKSKIKNLKVRLDDFPGGPVGFEMISRFCYNNGSIKLSVTNVTILHCCAIYLRMNEKISTCNLLQQTEVFLEGLFYWSWNDILQSLESCELVFGYAESCGLVEKLICATLAKISRNSDGSFIASSSSSSCSSDTASGMRLSPELLKPSSSSKAWWFNDLTLLSPNIIQKVMKTVGAYGAENNSLTLTRFLLHYLKVRVQKKYCKKDGVCYTGLADTAIYGVISEGKTVFSCRGLFCILRVVSGFNPSKECKAGLETMIGRMLDQATLDDLLVSAHNKGVYDVNFVLRLIKVFVHIDGVSSQQMRKVGRLIDQYLGEISPDQNLKISRFLGVAESLPDYARDSFDGVYRAIDIYLESHPTLSFDERSQLCKCLNYEKLSFETCKDLAKNPRIPPNATIQALKSQSYRIGTLQLATRSPCKEDHSEMLFQDGYDAEDCFSEESADMRLKLQKMQWKVVELEKACKHIKSQMSMARQNVISPYQTRGLPRLC